MFQPVGSVSHVRVSLTFGSNKIDCPSESLARRSLRLCTLVKGGGARAISGGALTGRGRASEGLGITEGGPV